MYPCMGLSKPDLLVARATRLVFPAIRSLRELCTIPALVILVLYCAC